MGVYLDTGMNVAEDLETLRIQQRALIAGHRYVQMFPSGTPELALPDGMQRHVNLRGVFHYNPEAICKDDIDWHSSIGRENVILNLGPFSKDDVLKRVLCGEKLHCLTEYTPEDVEVRSAYGSTSTIPVQQAYFEATKEPDNKIVLDKPPTRVLRLMKEINNGY